MSAPRASVSRVDILVITSIVLVLSLIAKVKDSDKQTFPWLLPGERSQLGAEYNTIAKNIRRGEGFASPFNVVSGPTAWMPPALPYFLAFLYGITGDNESMVVEIFVFVQGFVLIWSGLIAIAIARHLRIRWWGHAVFLIMLCENYPVLFQKTGDFWVNLAGLNFIYYVCLEKWSIVTRSPRMTCGWGVIGGLLALCNPIVGFVWASISTSRILVQPGFTTNTKRIHVFLVMVVSSIITITPWLLRNRLVLGEWIPIKSNVAYEIWQSQVLDDDGVLDSKSAWKHPWGHDGEQRAEYIRVGEIEFVSSRWNEVVDSISTSPSRFLQRVFNRFFAALVYYKPLVKEYEKLVWIMTFKRLVFPLPLIACFIIIVYGPSPLPRSLTLAVAIFIAYIGPYILISYYDRYAAPLLTIKAILILGGIWVVQFRLTNRPPNPSV